jgi:uncharacterized protein YkwD
MKRALLSVLMVLALFGSAASGSGSSRAETVQLPVLEAQLLAEINKARAARGLQRLVVAPGLQASARAHSRAMLESGLFQHDSPDGTRFSERIRRFYRSRGFKTWSVGENLLFHSARVAPGEAIDAWRDSAPHRRNMFNPTWREVGIGAVWAPSAPGDFVDASVNVLTVDFGARR